MEGGVVCGFITECQWNQVFLEHGSFGSFPIGWQKLPQSSPSSKRSLEERASMDAQTAPVVAFEREGS